MCGICGIFNLALEPVAHRERIDAMSARLEHRGPDSQGKFELPHLALAIRRLSIIDLETGNQPLCNESGDVTLVFNGEITTIVRFASSFSRAATSSGRIPTVKSSRISTKSRGRIACAS